MSDRVRPSEDPGSEVARAFLGRVRTRLVASSLFASAAFAAAVNEAVRWSSAAAAFYLGWKVPILGFLGLLVLAALVLPALRRWTPAASAAEADARLGLRDRLASWVDFRGRAEIPEAIRVAQAGETARALAGATPAAAAPISRWRKAGPALLVLCLVYQFFIPVRASRFSPLVNVIVPGWRLAPPLGGGTPGERADSSGAEEPSPGEKPEPGQSATPPAEAEKMHGEKSSGPKSPADLDERAGVEAKTRLANGDARKSGDRTRPAGPDDARGGEDPRQPGRIESERVGARLAEVVDPLYRSGASPARAALPSGVATFHLLPQAGAGGEGAGAGGDTVAPEPVRVDLDAVPAVYRPIVKAYFDHLARAAAPAGQAANPEPARSRP